MSNPIFFLHQNPFFRITLSLIIGILIANNFPSVIGGELLVLFAFVGAIVLELLKINDNYRQRHLHGILILIMFVGLGIVLMSSYTPNKSVDQTLGQNIRDKISCIYNKNLSEKNSHLVSALTIGDKSQLDKQTKKIFRDAGGAHILAVSGLHVGVIYITLTTIIGFFIRNYKIKRFTPILTILGLWIYAYICGLPPSVVRSALMFSLIAGATIFEAKNCSLNAIFFSAFCMLLYNPRYLFDIGFQLSYAAVISIILIQKKLYYLYIPKYKITDWAWSMICVSLAAQIGTTPISLYYFHQFPTYFLLTNFIVVPASSLIIYSSCTLLFTSVFPKFANYIGYILDNIVDFMIYSTHFISQLPYATIEDIQIDIYEVVTIYCIIFFTYISLISHKSSMVIMQLISICVFLSIGIAKDVSKIC